MHVKCAYESRVVADRVVRSEWKCDVCLDECRVPVRNDAAVPVPQAGVVCGLRVVQWNADCVMTKLHKLEGWLLENRIDVCMIQESKLRAEDGALRVRGYGCERIDRNRLLNGAIGRGWVGHIS